MSTAVVVVSATIHSPYALPLCSQDKVAMDLGFYYMANAMGRLVGVLMGGFLYYYTVSPRTIVLVFVSPAVAV